MHLVAFDTRETPNVRLSVYGPHAGLHRSHGCLVRGAVIKEPHNLVALLEHGPNASVALVPNAHVFGLKFYLTSTRFDAKGRVPVATHIDVRVGFRVAFQHFHDATEKRADHVVVGDSSHAGRVSEERVGWVRENHVGLVAVHEALHVLSFGRVATQEAVLTQEPNVAGFRCGLLRYFGDVVRVGESFRLLGFVPVDVQAPLVELFGFPFVGEHILVPFAEAHVVLDNELAVFVLVPFTDVDGHLFESGKLGRLEAHISPKHGAVFVDYDGTRFEHLGELLQTLHELVELVLAYGAGVVRVRPEIRRFRECHGPC